MSRESRERFVRLVRHPGTYYVLVLITVLIVGLASSPAAMHGEPKPWVWHRIALAVYFASAIGGLYIFFTTKIRFSLTSQLPFWFTGF